MTPPPPKLLPEPILLEKILIIEESCVAHTAPLDGSLVQQMTSDLLLHKTDINKTISQIQRKLSADINGLLLHYCLQFPNTI